MLLVMLLTLTAQTAWAYVGNTDPFMQVLSSPTYDDNGGKTVTVRLWVWNYDGDNAYYVSTPTLYIDDEATSVRPGSMWSTMLTTNENNIKDYTNSSIVGSSSDIVINNVNYGTAQLKNVQKNQTSAQGQSYGDGAQSKWTTVDLELNFNSAFSYGHHTLALTGQWLDHCDNKNKGSENKTVNASMTGVYGITIPDGFTVTGVNPSATYSSVNYYAQGTELTITLANEKRYIKSLTATGTGASATVADDKHSATVTVGTSDVTVNATILSTFSGGSGTQADPYKISSSADLVLLATDINNSTERLYVDEYFVQTCDIDMGGIDFVPIGRGERDFDKFRGKYNGQYDGKQYTISNLTVNGSYGKAGLFGHIADADLDNIRLVSPSITNTNANSYTGVLVGYSGISGIHNCIVINPTLSGGNHVGVFAGGQNAGNIRYSYFTGNNSYNSVGSYYSKNANTSIGPAHLVTLGEYVTATPAIGTDGANGFQYGGNSYYRDGIVLALDTDERTGYTCTGFETTAGTLNGSELTVTADATVNALWIKNAMTLIDNADNSVAITNAHGKVADVTLKGRTLYKDGKWNTLCLPFAMTAEQIAANSNFAGATLMTLDVTEKNGFDTADGTLYLWFKSATEIEAGVPYLVKWTKAADYEGNEANYDISNPVFEGVTISNTAAQAVESTTAGLEIVEMVGNYSPVSVTADDKSILFLSDANTLYYSSIDRQIRSCRAYFSVPYIKGNAGAKACAFSLNFDSDEATGIISIENGDLKIEKESDGWYDLNGRRLNGKPTVKGLYIHNGRKEVVE